jgi:hypothetical protein
MSGGKADVARLPLMLQNALSELVHAVLIDMADRLFGL